MKGKFLLGLLFALLALFTGAASAASSQPVVSHTFVCNGNAIQRTGPCPNGNGINSLIQGSDGNFYGTAEFSASGETSGSAGTIFSVTPAGQFTPLHTFVANAKGAFANGANPLSLTEGPDGKLYGLTNGGVGVVFRMDKTGSSFKVIHHFCSVGTSCSSQGTIGVGVLRVGKDGNIYGATNEGGTGCSGVGCGTIFRVTPSSGAYAVVALFTSDVTGFPYGLTAASDGTFYGLTANGSSLFHFDPATEALQLMALSFPFPAGCGGVACFATGTLAFGPSGNLYGLYTEYDTGGSGLFEVETDGSHLQLSPLYNATLLGGGPMELLLGGDGNFWIPESVGGTGSGDLIALSPSNGKVLQTLAPFGTAAPAGAFPSSLMQAKDGTLWGTASEYGVVPKAHFGGGTVYSVNLGLPPAQ
ncbi:MAG TPA: choice-of-anchor tandem repeat GloVer-containing protein [Candidatus Sulfotelmatobacter sp.]|nr:choice-of-anchor tandem repeat GloVer-containing protein [Candidatus Sulfotelmatobacter sp.]